MSTFGKMSAFPAGYFRAFSSWILRNRRDVASHVAFLGAELERIGNIRVLYQSKIDENGSIRATETRIGFRVTEGSSLARLIQAYVANGGNPYDISSFMEPDQNEVLIENSDGTATIHEECPGGGVYAPKSVEYNNPVGNPGATGYERYEGGDPALNNKTTERFYGARIGGKVDRGAWDSDTIVKTMHKIRGWANQAIKERLQDIEWRIIKLVDLREQLIEERESTLQQAFGGFLTGLPDEFDSERFSQDMLVQNLIQTMNTLLFNLDPDDPDSVKAYRANADTGFLMWTFPSTTNEEVRDYGLGG